MKRFGSLALGVALALSASMAFAQSAAKLDNRPQYALTQKSANSAANRAGHCPPGLAKKPVPCVPPGQAKKYAIGDFIYNGYFPIDNPGRWDLRSNGYYVRAGDYVYEINRETHEVLNLIGAVAAILN